MSLKSDYDTKVGNLELKIPDIMLLTCPRLLQT